MQALDSGCEELEICGTQRAICAEQEFGTAWDSLASTMSGAYGAFFCSAEPTDEPTCVPSRPGEFPLASDDADGDGLADSEDNCPSVFNPIRPMDDGVQSDQDDDGLGDPCDEDPIKPDLDGDGQANADDNCPFDANADQADDDADGTGDVCDVCPETSNPDSICPEAVVQVYAIQKGEVAEGTDVRVEGLVVTGLVYNGFGAQHAEGGQYSGIFVYTDTDPGVSVGDLVNVDGTTTEYYGETEIVAMAWEVTGTGSTTPQDLTAEDAADEAWEGVLVTVSGSVTNSAYDCSVDGADCKDEGLWEIAGSAGVVVYDKYYTDSDWADHVGQTPVTGVMGYRWDRRRLMPRSGSDF